jgi:hypothetical protein
METPGTPKNIIFRKMETPGTFNRILTRKNPSQIPPTVSQKLTKKSSQINLLISEISKKASYFNP